MKQVSTKKRGAILACSALMAVSLTGGLAFLHGGVEASADGEATYAPKLYYYVDAGNFVKPDGSGERFPGRDGCEGDGVPTNVETNFMKAYGLHYGTKDDAGNVTGLYNSVADNQLKEDEATGKTWGVDPTNYGWAKWRVLTTNSTNTLYDGYQTGRHSEGTEYFTYKFEVDDATTPLKITIGARSYDNGGWGPRDYSYQINNLTPATIHAPANDDAEQVSSTLWANETITGVEEDGKYFVTLTVGKETDGNAYLNWIMIATDNYELPVAYTLPTFVKSDATQVTATPSDGTGAVEATITEESKAALAAAAPLSEVEITVNVGEGKTSTSTVTVIPASTTYFVNVGDEDGANTYGGATLADLAYTQANGYGYIQEDSKAHSGQNYPGSAQWKDDAYNISCRADMDTIVYQFDVTGSSYAVIVGIVEHWAQWPVAGGRRCDISVNGGATTLLTLPIENNASVNGVAYGDPVDGTLKVKIDTKCPEANVIAYILVYEHEHDANLTHHEAVAPTCTTDGVVEYYTCETCGQNYSDAAATTLITDTKGADATGHDWDYTNITWNWNEYECTTATVSCSNDGCEETNTLAVTVTSEVTTEATCSATGTKTYTATINDTSYTDTKTETLAKLPHSYDDGFAWGDWDTENHTITYTAECTVCHEGVHDEQAVITSAVTTEPTCTSTGVMTYTATAGTETTTMTETIDMIAHTAVHHDAVAATCTATGTEEYWTCENCDKLFSDATCETEIEAVVVTEKIDHTIVHHDAVAPTIEQAGNEEYWQCSVCETLFSDENGETVIDEIPVIPAQHTLVHHDAVAATCTTEGSGEYWQCSVCEKMFSDENGETEIEAVPTIAAGHTAVHHDAVAATCEAAGSGEYWSCSVCNKMYSDEACTTEITAAPTVAALGHDWTVTWTWNGTEGATVKLVCKHDATHTKEATATITSEVTKEATKDEEGVTTYTAKATIDGKDYTDTKTAPIEKLEGGCGSAMSVGAMSGLAGLAAVCALVCLRKKEKNN